MKRILTSFICIILAITFTATATNQSDLNKVITEKNQIQKNIDAAEDKKDAAKQEFEQIEKNMIAIQDEINEIDSRLTTLDQKKQTITAELDEAAAKEKKQEQTLKTRLRVMYEDGVTSYFKILLSSESLFDFFYNLERLSQITEYDDKVLADLTKIKNTIADKKKELEGVIADVEAEKNLQVAKKSELQKQSDLKVAYMKSLENDIAKYKANYEKAEAEEAKIRAEINAAAPKYNPPATPQTQYSGGKLQWPAPTSSRITSQYGYRVHPIFKTSKLHRGIDIGVGTGSPIVAAADGVVIKATYNSSYGYYVSINHGGGLVTLYAHNSSLKVSAGQSVKRGQLISYSGNTGNSTGPHLHFEVMLNGATTNPLNYLK